MDDLTEAYETMLVDQEPTIPAESNKDEEEAQYITEFVDNTPYEEPAEGEPKFTVITAPFFGPDKKYGACPVCAAVIIEPNDTVTTHCPNCKSELNLK